MKADYGELRPHWQEPFSRINPRYTGVSITLALILAVGVIASKHDEYSKKISDALAANTSAGLKFAFNDPWRRVGDYQRRYGEVVIPDQGVPVTKAFGRKIATIPNGGRAVDVIEDLVLRKVYTGCDRIEGLVLNDPNDRPAEGELCEFPAKGVHPPF